MVGMVFSVLFLGVIAWGCWYVGTDGPRERGGRYWKGRPGLRTGATLSSEAAWLAAHRRIARPMRLMAHLYGTLTLVAGVLFVLDVSAQARETFLLVAVFAALGVLCVLAVVGELAALAVLERRDTESRD